MNRQNVLRLAAVVVSTVASAISISPVAAVSIDLVPVGDPGNAPLTSISTGTYGTVNYSYQIGKYEVTNNQYIEFLNAKAKSDPYNLYSAKMGTDVQGGIARNGSSGNYTYSARTNMGNKPVNYIGWFDAIRFVNWLSNGQGNGDTESGTYLLLGGTVTPSNLSTLSRSPNARWVLASEDEWVKAAYYDPRTAAQGGPPGNDHYWLYATQSDNPPTAATANSSGDVSNAGANVANYRRQAVWNGEMNLTTVGGAGLLSGSYYGTFDQAGNVAEWTDTLSTTFPGDYLRDGRGGSLVGDSGSISADHHDTAGALDQDSLSIGFRVAMLLPEPSSIVLFAVGALGIVFAAPRRLRCAAEATE